DRNVRYARLAGDFAASVKAGEESVAQVSGVREQAILTEAIRSELKTQGVLGHPEVTMTALSDRNVRYARLAGDFAASVKAGEESVAQVSGVRE
ncbi:hypothetical protein, partial [Enterobacter hormaechei]|uniref:hypothetical protein n=1 Tax=Enterobacter hormaechei TaxID=158836 RepID=UPI003133922D